VRRQDTRVNRLKAAWGGPRLAVMHFAFLALVPVAVFANKGTVPVFLFAALPNLYPSALLRLWAHARLLTLAVAGLCLWALISLAYAPEPDLLRAVTHVALPPLGLIWIAGLVGLPMTARAALARTLLIAVLAIVALFLFEIATGGSITRLLHPQGFSQAIKLYERIAVGQVLLIGLTWPVAFCLWQRHRLLAAAFLAGVVVCALSLPMAAAVLALLAGAVSLLLAWRWPRAIAGLTLICLLGYIFAAPTLSRDWLTITDARQAGLSLPSGWEHRLGIWNYVAVEIDGAGLLGAGYDASRVIGRRDDLITEIVGLDGKSPEALPLHPHNAVLQVWLELGLPGALLLALALTGIYVVLLRAPLSSGRRAAAMAVTATLLVPFLLSFGVWQSWWLAALMLCAGGTVVLLAPVPAGRD